MTSASSAGRLIAYGLPAAPLALLGLPLYAYVPGFYAGELGLSLAGVGAVLLAARVLDVITDPLVGWASDHWPGRYRRKALMLLGMPVLLAGVFWLFRPAAHPDLVSLGLAAFLTYLGWTLLSVPYLAWGAELEGRYDGRTRLAAAREAFVLAGTLLALVGPTLMGVAGDQRATLALYADTLPWLLLPAALFAASLVPELPRAVAAPGEAQGSGAWRAIAGHAALRRLMLAYFLNGLANGIPATLFLLFVGHVVGSDDWAGPLLIAYFVSGILGLPVWWRVSRHFGKHRTWCVAMLFCAGVFATVPWVVGAGQVAIFAVICVLTGLTLGADVALPAAMQADVIEADALRHRRQRAALLFGLWGMVTKLALAFAVGVSFPLLAAAGFRADAVNVPEALGALALTYSLLPALIKLGAVALMWRFPIDAKALERLRTESNYGGGYVPSLDAPDPDARTDGFAGVRPDATGGL